MMTRLEYACFQANPDCEMDVGMGPAVCCTRSRPVLGTERRFAASQHLGRFRSKAAR